MKPARFGAILAQFWRNSARGGAIRRYAALPPLTPRHLRSRRRDHRAIGKALDLFSIQEDAGGGLVFWHPKGSTVRRLMEDYWRQQHLAAGYELLYTPRTHARRHIAHTSRCSLSRYELLYTPHMASLDLWKTSGHFDFYKEGMFDQMEVEGAEYQLKPMNCPFHVLTFKDTPKSYRDLPLRWAELGTVYRYERSGTLNGLFRVRGFTQDDAHIFCLPEQLEDELVDVLVLFQQVLTKFGFTDYEVMLSTKPEKAVGSDDIWEKSTAALEGALKRHGWEYSVDEGGGAFYGPKIDLKIRDAIGRLWQCSTVQCDFNLPERFEIEYTTADGEKERPIMVHRAIFGSIERFFGVLIESTAGDFPFWLAPTQLRLLPVSDDFLPYCREVVAKAKAAGIRAEVDRGGRSLGKQIKLCARRRWRCTASSARRRSRRSLLSLTSRKGGDLGQMTLDSALGAMVAAVTDDSEPHEMMG